jgi:hypothetical protein
MPLPENCCSTLFITGYKRLTKGRCKTFAFGFCFWLVALGFLMKEGYLDVGGLWSERRLLERRIAKGELLASLRAEILRKLKRTWGSASLH